ncbi:MAG: GNAT family N-acetyltransferase [candidate division KSB1 bacterium]|nr:GNAT family N-acetyltransferase [candidate division KSB1 bacterium]MDZ7302452.1 GNAT family N-acetyltransferase [candidate division KSB1 bacterium]MDZ7311954.1 GNAT family N-acetyltransferase [candidate division KSB1 bacterium]
MGIVIREAVLPADRNILLDTLLRNRQHGDQTMRQARFEWSLSRNPYGQPRAWLAIDESSGKVVGAVSAFPRRVLINGAPVLAWNGADTSIDKDFRTLGVAIKLRRAVKECVDRGEMRFLYSHPVENMRVVLEKVGHVVIGRLARHSVILRFDRFLNKWTGKNLFSSMLAHVANPVLLAWRGNWLRSNGLAVRLQAQTRFDDEYDELFDSTDWGFPVIAVRDAQFLSWRFLQNPTHKEFCIFRLEEEKQLRGYAVVDFQGDGARILDFLTPAHGEKAGVLLAGIIRWLRAHGYCSLSVRASDHNPILPILRSFGPGFCDTVNSSIAVHAHPEGPDRIVLNEQNWFMTQADRDV